jgi:hypothetical protein
MNLTIETDKIIKRNKLLQNSCHGKIIHLIGNGPSLLTTKLTKIDKKDVVIVVNSYFKNPIIKHVDPSWLVLADPDYYREPGTYKDATESINCDDLNLLTPIESLPAIFQTRARVTRKWYFEFDRTKEDFSVDISEKVKPIAQNVLSLCIALGIFMGSKHVYIHGFDMDILAINQEQFNQDWAWNHHYNDKEELRKHGGLKQHFTKQGMGWPELELSIAKMQREFQFLRNYSQSIGIQITNTCPGSRIEWFNKTNSWEI